MEQEENKTFDPTQITAIYTLPIDFFKAPNFIGRYRHQMDLFKKRIHLEEKEKVKRELNAFYVICANANLSKNEKLQVHLVFFNTLNVYSQQYQSAQTCKNIIKAFESQELKG